MHVVIMGCGRVGSTLARSLEDRNHTVSIIDSNPDAFRRLGPSFNGIKVTGYGFDQKVLTDAGIERADAFAAVSSGDNSNIIAARVARETFGIEQVVARIYDPGRAEVYQRLGITTVATVKWTADQVLRPAPAGGRRARLPRSVRDDPARPDPRTRLLDRPPHRAVPGTVALPDRVDRPARRGNAAAARLGDPGGRPAPRRHARGERDARLQDHRARARGGLSSMRVAIAGAGAVGRSIARELITNGHQVLLIDKEPGAIKPERVPDAEWLLADSCELSSLEEARLEHCDVVIAATGDDKANLVTSLLAKTEFGVPRTVGRVNHPNNEWLFTEAWGVDVNVSTPRIMSALVEEAVTVGDLVRLFTFRQGNANLVEMTLPAGSPYVGKPSGLIPFPENVALVTILRDGQVYTPDPQQPVEAGDELLFVCQADVEEELEQVLAPRESHA
ncbi:Trk K+ transport system NAD-binding subunit [Marmoricola sp. URHA0025 HA25]